jgi:hypothetical protein
MTNTGQCAHTRTHAHTHARTHAHTHTHTRTRTRTHTHAQVISGLKTKMFDNINNDDAHIIPFLVRANPFSTFYFFACLHFLPTNLCSRLAIHFESSVNAQARPCICDKLKWCAIISRWCCSQAVAEHAEIRGVYPRKVQVGSSGRTLIAVVTEFTSLRTCRCVQCGLVLMDYASNGELFDAIVRTDSNGDKVIMRCQISHA